MGFRPNATPARQKTIGDRVKNIVDGEKWRAGFRVRRTSVQDLCDFCLKTIRVYRTAMGFRNRGWKFSCKDCYRKKKLNAKVDKVWVEITY